MSGDLAPIGAIVEFDTRTAKRNIADFVRDAGRVDDAMDEIVASANRAQKSIDNISGDADFKVNVNDGEIDAAVRKQNDLNTNTSFTADVNESEIDTAIRRQGDLNENTSFTANVDDGEVERLLDQIKMLSVIDIALNFTGAGVSMLQGLFDLTGVPLIIELDTAQAAFTARTGGVVLPQEIVDQLQETYNADFGESMAQIFSLTEEAYRQDTALKDTPDAVLSALQAAQVMSEDVNSVLRTQSQMVRTELVGSYREAADILVSGFQLGVNRGEDWLDTFNEYSAAFADFGLTGEEALAVINGGMSAGLENSDRVGMGIQELNLRLKNMEQSALDAVDAIGFDDELDLYMSGEMSGADFLDGLFAAISEQAPEVQQQILTALFGSVAEDYGVEAIQGMAGATDEMLIEVEGAAERASDTMSNNLESAFSQVKRTFQTEAANWFNDQFDIDKILEDVKSGISTFFDELEAGNDLFASIEIAFGLDGLTDTINNLRDSVLDLAINLLQFVSNVQGVLGYDNSGTNSAIQSIRTTQFNLQLGDARAADTTFVNGAAFSREAANAVANALNDGVERSNIESALQDRIAGALEAGNVDFAQGLINAGTIYEDAPGGGFTQIFDLTAQQEAVNAATQLNDLFTQSASSFQAGLTVASAEAKNISHALMPLQDLTAAGGDRPLIPLGNSAIELPQVNEDFTTLIDNVHGFAPVLDAVDGDGWLTPFTEGIPELISGFGEVETSITGMDDTGTTAFDSLGGGWMTFNDTFGGGVDTLDANAQRVMAIFENLQLAAFNANLAVAGFNANVNNTTNNVNVTTNNPAAANSATQAVANQIRQP